MVETASADRAAEQRPLVLHVSGDFPDPYEPFKTPVIRNLIGLTKDAFEHRVISINRAEPGAFAIAGMVTGTRALKIETQPFEHGTALRYTAPGKGIRHRAMLEQLGDTITHEALAMKRTPDLIVGHKLTIEGIAVARAAKQLGIPYALSIQGNTDTKILARRPDLTEHLATIYSGASVVFPFAPWSLRDVELRLGERSGPTRLLPCPTDLDQPRAPATGGNGLISVFHLKNYANKNLAGIVGAYRILAKRGTPPPLEVIGGGTDEELAACRHLARDFPQITFTGPLGREELATRMRAASALIMPSFRESFGLVFVESLFAGTPIIYPRGASVDGYFDEVPFALGADARRPASIANAIEQAMTQESEMKRALAEWQKSPAAQQFTRASIAETFAAGLNQALRRM